MTKIPEANDGHQDALIRDGLSPLKEQLSLAGTTALVTGGSRDIGRAIVEALTAEGAKVEFSFQNKNKKANETLLAVVGNSGSAYAFQADITTPEGREQLMRATTQQLGTTLNFLILNTSGPTAAVNGEASNHLLDLALPYFQPGSVVIRLQSVPGKYHAQLRGLGLTAVVPIYGEVARAKYEDMQSLRKRQKELAEKGILLVEIAAPFVPDTANVTLFERVARQRTGGSKTAQGMHTVITEKLGLPPVVSSAEVGMKIAELLKNPHLKTGHTELFCDLIDMQATLEQWYGVPQVYVQTLEMQGAPEGRKQGIGRAIVSLDQAQRSGEPAMIDHPYTGVVRITPAHAAGHFRDGEGEDSLPKILPAHKQLRAAVEIIRMMEQQQGTAQGPVRLAGFDRAIFQRMVIADGNSELRIMLKRMEGGRHDVEIQLMRGGGQEICAQIEGLRVQPAVETDDPVLLEDQLLEGAAQTVGAVEGQDTDEQHLPLLMEIGPTDFSGSPVRAGDGVAYHTITERANAQQIVGIVKIHSEGKPIGESVIQARIVPKALLQRHLKSK